LYPILDVKLKTLEFTEPLGTKEKFWVKSDEDGSLYLLKFGRLGTGENWAEKIACELCRAIDLQHAHYNLAVLEGKQCVLSSTIIATDSRLILGNELIASVKPSYDGTRTYRQSEHTISRVLAALATFTVERQTSWHNFIGYLMLDGWIGNTDRHHENWGIIIDKNQRRTLAPTFDHASSLGRELTDEKRQARLDTNDKRFAVSAFAARARGALYNHNSPEKPMNVIDAFKEAAKSQTASGKFWIGKLEEVGREEIERIVNSVPKEFMTDTSKAFTIALLIHNRDSILRLVAAQ
jgi:hypothetical protein